ncbi:MAG: GOLPH3/VPS74 family protein [Chloroflexota bacterium]
MLTLYEELFLLALDEERGNIFSFARQSLPYSLAGGILAELALAGKLSAGEKLRLVLCESTPLGDPILDGALEQICLAEKNRKPAYWISYLSEDAKKLRHSVGESLVRKNVLIQDEKRFFRQVCSAEETPPAAPEKFEMKRRLRALILSNGENDLRNLVLLKMMAAGNLLGLIFTQDELITAAQMIHKKFLAAALGNTVMQVFEEIEHAVCSVREDETS